jgi:hypothetical protein
VKLFSKSSVYKALKYSNDANAVVKNKVPRRVGRRVYGKAAGRLARKLLQMGLRSLFPSLLGQWGNTALDEKQSICASP